MRQWIAGIVVGVLLVMSVRMVASLDSDARWMLGGLVAGLLVAVPVSLLVAAGKRRQMRRPIIGVYLPEDAGGAIVKRETNIVTS